MKLCNKVLNFLQNESGYSVMTDGAEIRILFMTDDIIRIRAGFDGDFAEESYTLTTTAWDDRMDSVMGNRRKKIQPAKSVLSETEQKIILLGSKLQIEIEKDPFRICIFNQNGICLHADTLDLGYQEDSNHRRIHTSEIFDGDCFYGFGESTGKIDKAGSFISLGPGDCMGYNAKETNPLYKHIPFYIKGNKKTKIACGYFYHTTYECDFNMGRSLSNYWKKSSRFRTDGGDIDLFFISGPAISDIIERYTDLTGKPCMLPEYALGYLGSSMYYAELDHDCDDAILGFIDTSKKEDIPIDAFHLSSGYTVQDKKRYVFTWNKKRFKDPKDFFEAMEKRDITVLPNVKPGLLLTHPLLKELEQENIFVKESKGENPCVGTWWGGKGFFADFTRENTRRVWKKYLTDTVLDYGTSSVWNDNCEYDSIVDKDASCSFEGKGGTIGQLRSVMSNLMCQVTEEAIQENEPDIRPFIICRSGHAGIQRYAQTWGGDNYTSWDSLKYNIAMILGMGLCGVSNYGCDIGGFFGPAPEAELFVRWVQNGIFQPRFSIHSANTDNTVTEPWMYPSYKAYIREAIKFRYRMIPYLYSLMERSHRTGLPILQPMFAVFQNDERCYQNGVDFMVGDSLLVANVVEKGQTTREVYLPEGDTFYDFYTREKYVEGQKIKIPVTLASIPLFVRGGAIIPMADNQMYNLHRDKATSLHILMAPDRDGEFVLYEDDGISMDYTKGKYRKETITMKSGERVRVDVKREGSYSSSVKSILVDMIHRGKAPLTVSLNGKVLPCFQYQGKFDTEDSGWHYSQELKSVLIKYPNPEGNYCLEVSFEQSDLLGM